MGSCCTKSSEPPVRKHQQQHHQQVEGLRAKNTRTSKQQQQHQQGTTSSKAHQNGGVPIPVQSKRSREQQTPARLKSVPENHHHNNATSAEQAKPPEVVPKRPPTAKKPTARVGSNIKDNKETIPLGKRTNFGYERDFKQKYTLGKLLGHGQFGYTYVAIEKATGEKMAVKTIEKKQVCTSSSSHSQSHSYNSFPHTVSSYGR